MAGADPSLTATDLDIFAPGTPMAGATGMEITRGAMDLNTEQEDLAATGYKGGKILILVAPNVGIRANGRSAWFGWPRDATMGALHDSCFDAPDVAAQKQSCEAMQVEFWRNPPYAPMGVINEPAGFNKRITDVPEGWPRFPGLKKA